MFGEKILFQKKVLFGKKILFQKKVLFREKIPFITEPSFVSGWKQETVLFGAVKPGTSLSKRGRGWSR